MRVFGAIAVCLCACSGQNRATSAQPAFVSSQVAPQPGRWLPAGLYFREFSYTWRCGTCPPPHFAAALGPYTDPSEATAAARRLKGLPVGYPWAVRAPRLGLSDESLRGIVVVAGLFEERADATAVAASIDDARVHRVSAHAGYDAETEAKLERQREWLVQIEDGAPVLAYSEATARRLLNLDGKGEHSAALAKHLPQGWRWAAGDWIRALNAALDPQPALCSVAPGSIHVEVALPSISRADAFAPVRCPDGQLAFVPYSDTRVDAVVLPTASGDYQIVQPALIECDRGWQHSWGYDRTGRQGSANPYPLSPC